VPSHYRAFLSYSHAGDDRLAAALQYGLQQFAKPYYALRALDVFRDKTDLGASLASGRPSRRRSMPRSF
jgi:hypothetical protein